MTSVNLMPNALQLERQRKKRLCFWCAAMMLFLCTISTWVGVKYFSCRDADESTNSIIQQTKQIKEKIQTLAATKEQLELFKDRYTLLAELDHYTDFYEITGYLAQHSPKLIYLDQMSFSQFDGKSDLDETIGNRAIPKAANMFLVNNAKQNNKNNNKAATKVISKEDSSVKMVITTPVIMQLKGKAFNYQAVADYLTVLNDSGLFRYVQLKRTGRKTKGSSSNYEKQQDQIGRKNIAPSRNTELVYGEATSEKRSPKKTGTTDKAFDPMVEFEIECMLSPATSNVGVNYANMQKTKNL